MFFKILQNTTRILMLNSVSDTVKEIWIDECWNYEILLVAKVLPLSSDKI